MVILKIFNNLDYLGGALLGLIIVTEVIEKSLLLKGALSPAISAASQVSEALRPSRKE